MINTIHGMLPRLLTGETNGIARMLDDIKDWDKEKVKEEFDKVPGRYYELYDEELGDYAGLLLFTQIVHFFKEQNHPYSDIITEARKRVVMYHNVQFKNESSYSKLSEES